MEILLFIGLIVWIASSAAKKKAADRARQAAVEAKARQTAEAPAQQAAPVQAPRAPIAPTVRTTVPERPAPRHPLEPSEYTGHAHMETSMTGREDCPPPKAPASASSPWQCKICGSKMSGGRFCELCGAPRPAAPQPVRPAQKPQRAHMPVQSRPLHIMTQTVHEDSAVPVSVEIGAQKPVFNWDPDHVRDGLLYAEILGSPRARRPLYPARRA